MDVHGFVFFLFFRATFQNQHWQSTKLSTQKLVLSPGRPTPGYVKKSSSPGAVTWKLPIDVRNLSKCESNMGMGQNPGTPGEHQNSW